MDIKRVSINPVLCENSSVDYVQDDDLWAEELSSGLQLPTLSENQLTALYCIYRKNKRSKNLLHEVYMLSNNIFEGYQYDDNVRHLLGNTQNALSFIGHVKSWSVAQKVSVIYKMEEHLKQDVVLH